MIAYLSGLLHQAALSSYCTDGSEGTVVDASWSLPSCSLSLTNGLREIVEKPLSLNRKNIQLLFDTSLTFDVLYTFPINIDRKAFEILTG